MTQAITTGDEMPADFPSEAYNNFHRQNFVNTFDVATRHPEAWAQYGGAINGVAYRFLGMQRAHDDFLRAFSPNGASRTDEEIAFHTFFVCALSVVECSAYAAYGVLSMIDHSAFPITKDALRRATSPVAVALACTGDPRLGQLGAAFGAIDHSPVYRQLKEIRNTLSHRQAPPRHIFLELHDGPAPPPAPPRSTELQFGHLLLPAAAPASLEIDSTTLNPYRAWVIDALMLVLDGLQSVASEIPH